MILKRPLKPFGGRFVYYGNGLLALPNGKDYTIANSGIFEPRNNGVTRWILAY
jgi:hypothetical protein